MDKVTEFLEQLEARSSLDYRAIAQAAAAHYREYETISEGRYKWACKAARLLKVDVPEEFALVSRYTAQHASPSTPALDSDTDTVAQLAGVYDKLAQGFAQAAALLRRL